MRTLICAVLLLSFASCDRDDPTEVLAEPGTIRVLLDGRTLNADNVEATISNTTGEILVILATFPENPNTQLSIAVYSNNTNDVIDAGEYEFGSKTDKGPYDGVCQYVLNDGNAPFSTTAISEDYVGKVNLTELDRAGLLVSGTFEATVGRNAEVKNLTKGSFTKIKLKIN